MVSRLGPSSTVSSGVAGMPSWRGIFFLRNLKLDIGIIVDLLIDDVHKPYGLGETLMLRVDTQADYAEFAPGKTPPCLYKKVRYMRTEAAALA
ncbi:hypothetical protein ACHAPU_004209 [Fusarium lateritium]